MATMVPIHAFTFERHDFFYLVWASNHQEIPEDHKNSILRTKHVIRTSMFTANHDLSLNTLAWPRYIFKEIRQSYFPFMRFSSNDMIFGLWQEHRNTTRSPERLPYSSVVPRAAGTFTVDDEHSYLHHLQPS